MPDWVIWVVLCFLFIRWRGRSGAGCAPQRLRAGQRSGRGPMHGDLRRGGDSTIPRAALKAESPLEALKRRYVNGSITVEQYEAELDRLFSRGA